MPNLEKLNGPPFHLKVILKCLSHVPKALTLLVHSNLKQSYSEFITQIMETVHLCDGVDSRLDISIHFCKCHFAPHNYRFNVDAIRALGVNCPGAK